MLPYVIYNKIIFGSSLNTFIYKVTSPLEIDHLVEFSFQIVPALFMNIVQNMTFVHENPRIQHIGYWNTNTVLLTVSNNY